MITAMGALLVAVVTAQRRQTNADQEQFGFNDKAQVINIYDTSHNVVANVIQTGESNNNVVGETISGTSTRVRRRK